MKKIFISMIFISIVSYANAQVVIGDNSGNIQSNSKAILSFTSQNMGIIPPIINASVEDASTGNIIKVPGTIFVSRKDKQVKVYMTTSPVNTSGLLALTPSLPSTVNLPTANTSAETTATYGMVIGDNATTQQGVLVLEDNTKTLVLPQLGTTTEPPNKFVKSPYIGTFGFSEIENAVFPSTKPTKKFMWVFGGGDSSIAVAGQWQMWRSGVEMPPTEVIDQTYFDNLL
ncbi:hypothetical protein [Chryseobacterium oryzae]|uniref:IgGFc-binding protein N-terminal domain-containing protein n=1 Tax=Chryseobacterium oryzae TaxID=2929799 RepID=A0ABY4BGW4_9FLAO|nr:hypothetical protein [Chryseobacterium oryzae]UOE37979.1 hypothetical protein MTP08_13130 [Chryseobacterium oryzae]